ncbi:Uncharacterised protein [Escherichia coli]|nr:Uncharacterised protein [Escherichia coli]CAD6167116.1 Uncharacterised protein [Escherichia coli]
MINTVHNFHHLIAVASELSIIEQVQQRNPVRSEIVQHTACFCVTVTIHPDPVQSSDGSGNDVPCILRGDEQFFTGQITVVGLIYGERLCFHKHGNMPAELTLAAQLFSCTLSVLTNCLSHGFISCDTFPKASAADYLLFGGRCFLQ